MQDYEYLYLAAERGFKEEVTRLVDECIPAALEDAKGDVAWSSKGDDWDDVRLKLAELIVSK